MLRNILFILLFILVYGAVFLLGSYRPENSISDRTENGEFITDTDGSTRYATDRYGFELSYAPDWIVFDGVQLEKQLRDNLSVEEIEDNFDCPIENLAFLGGFLTPRASLRVTVEKGNTLPSQSFTADDIKSLIDETRDWIVYSGGSWGNGSGYLLPAQGNSERIILYYYDYEYLGEYYSTFCAMLNANGNIIYLDGYYSDLDGLSTLTDFVKNGLRMTSPGDSAV